jgi:hypothetical protein
MFLQMVYGILSENFLLDGFFKLSSRRTNVFFQNRKHWCQFHQHFTRVFFVRTLFLFSSYVLALSKKKCTKNFNVGEIDGWYQFHQHFTRVFFVQKCFFAKT